MHTAVVTRALFFFCIFASALGAAQLIDETHGFRVETPENLPKARIDPARYPDTLYMYAEAERGGLVLQFMLLPEELRQPQGSPPRNTAGAAEVQVLWRGYTLARRHRYFAGTQAQAVEISVDVPVAKRGVRVALTGPVKRETEMVGLFTFVLEHFEARSNWTIRDVGGAPGPLPPSSRGEETGDSADSQTDPTIGIAAAIALILGFVGGWWLRGLGARPIALLPPVAEPPKPEPPLIVIPAPIVAKAPAPAAPVKRPPDETDPGMAIPKCRVCGAGIREGKKVCMNCGSEVY